MSVCVSHNSARTAHAYKHRYHHFWVSAGKHLSRVGFLGIPKSQQNVDLSKTGSVSRIRTFCDFLCFRKKFPRGPGDGFCDFVCFRTSKISGYFQKLNKCGDEVYKSPGCFAALRRYPCLRVQSSILSVLTVGLSGAARNVRNGQLGSNATTHAPVA